MQTLLRLQRSLEAAPWSCAVLAEWQERFGQDLALLKPHLKPTGERAGVFPCPNGGGDGCPRQVHERDGGFVAVCGNVPAECEPIPLTKTELAVLALDRAAALGPVVARVCAEEALAATSVAALEGLLPLGVLERRVGRTLVVLATGEGSGQRGAILELRRAAGADAVAVVVAGRTDARLVGEGHAELGLDAPGLRLHRALKLLWPESWAARAKAKEAIFEDVELVFASEPERHVVRLNGELLAAFRVSDAKFARLLRLAAARVAATDVEEGGWLKKAPHLQLDEREVDLGDRAVAQAFGVVAEQGTVHLAHVIPVVAPTDAEARQNREQAWYALSRVTGTEDTNRSGRLERHVLEGAPADQLLALADRIGADLIVLGARSHSVVTRALLGSVAQAVSERAKVPVLAPVTAA